MNRRAICLVAAALTVFAAASYAADSGGLTVAPPAPSSPASADSAAKAPATPAAAAPASDAKAPAATAPDAKPAIKPAPEAKPATAAPVPAAPAAEAKPEVKPLNPAAAKFEPVAASYQQAHDSLLAWLRSASRKMDAIDGKIADLKKRLEEKEAPITELSSRPPRGTCHRPRAWIRRPRACGRSSKPKKRGARTWPGRWHRQPLRSPRVQPSRAGPAPEVIG